MQRSAISLAVLALWANASAAQTEVTLEKVQITGSNISRVENETATPTLVLTRKDIERTGLATVKEVLDSLVGTSQLSNGSNRTLSDITSGASYAAGSSAVSLRHLGPQATLVLLNSRRLAPYAMHDDPTMVTDVNALPLSAVERIEVLRNGGSAVYGSDAIAGVINIITKQDFTGITMRASQEQSTEARDFRASTVGLTAGFGNLAEDRFNVMMNVEFYKRSAVMWSDVMGKLDPGITNYFPSFGSPSTYSYPGNIIEAGGALAGCAPAQVVDGLCMYDRYSRLEAQPSSERASLLLNGRLKIQPDLEGFAEVMLSSNKTVYTLADPAYGLGGFASWFDPSTGLTRQFYERGLPSEHPLNPTGLDEVDFRYRFSDANSQQKVDSQAYRVLGGLRGLSGRYNWEGAAGVMGSTVVNDTRGAYSDSAFKALIGDYNLAHDPLFFNRGYRIGQPNSAEVLNALFPVFSHTGRMKQAFVDGKVTGPVSSFQGRPVDMAVGFDLRHESLDITPSANLASGDIVGYGVAETHGQRTFGSVFAEVNLPLADSLEVQAAARLDKYPNFDVNLSPKVGLRYVPTKSLLLRATVEAGFRAPNLVESSTTTLYSYDNGIVDPKRCPQASALANDLRAQAAALPEGDPARVPLIARADIVETQECVAGVAAVRGSNTELKPETSLGTTLGLVFEPIDNLQIELDAWRIQRRDEIGYMTPQSLINSEDGEGAGRVQRVGLVNDRSFTAAEQLMYGVTAGALSGTFGQYQNSAKTLAQGVDIGARSRALTSLGVVSVSMQATFLDTFRQYSTANGDYGDNLAGRYGYPRWRAYLTTALESGPFSNALRLNFTSSTKLQGDYYDTLYTEEACASYGWTARDCSVRYQTTLDWAFAWTGIKGLVVGLNVRNLLNTRPSLDLRALDESGGGIIPQSLADAYRRTVRLSLEYKFL
ncbi:MAG: TonB-dependent receptor [Rhizobacter sp.]